MEPRSPSASDPALEPAGLEARAPIRIDPDLHERGSRFFGPAGLGPRELLGGGRGALCGARSSPIDKVLDDRFLICDVSCGAVDPALPDQRDVGLCSERCVHGSPMVQLHIGAFDPRGVGCKRFR